MTNNILILGAGHPFTGEQHPALRHTNGSGRVLDWALQASRQLKPDYYFISGYQAQEVQQRYSEFKYIHNNEWQSTKAGWSLMLGLDQTQAQECFVFYSDILFRPNTIAALHAQQNADVVIAVDSHWRTRYEGRSETDLQRSEKLCLANTKVTLLGASIALDTANAEFIGLVRFSANAVSVLQALYQDRKQQEFLKKLNLSELIEHLRILGLKIKAVDVEGDWAQLNEPADLARFVLGTKAQTLSRLHGMVKLSRIEDQVSFTVEQWQANQAQCLSDIQSQFKGISLVARSSALSEDGFNNSNAGAYTSVLNIDGTNQQKITQAIETVIASYPDANSANEVLVQPMLTNVLASGVVFTRSLGSGAPYYIANYDESGSTESITDGSSQEHTKLVMRRDASAQSQAIPKVVQDLLPALREIESLLGYSSLDIEFAVTKNHGLHILQVRPIAVDHC